MSLSTFQRQDEQMALSASDVEAYLRMYPDFFHQHLDLLETLKVPHPSGEAVSLVLRQIGLLREKNRKLQHQLEDILQIARDNDALHQRIHQLTLTLLDAASLEDGLAGLKWGLHQYFQTDFVAVRIMQPEITTPVADLYATAMSMDRAIALFGDIWESGKPRCGKPAAEQAEFLFGRDAPEVQSYALVPLQHAGLRGLLAIGSRSSSRFQSGMGFLFLNQMGEVVSARFAALVNVRP